MMNLAEGVWLLLAAYNGLVFLVYVLDKLKARSGRWRISEETLLRLALFGGSAGALIGVYLVRHKRRKPRFALGVPLMLLGHLALYLGIRRLF